MASSERSSSCCISHHFYEAAAKVPEKIAVVHAAGFSKIARSRRLGIDDGGAHFSFAETTSSTRGPPLYDGDSCFTFSELLCAVENLSFRLRRILDGVHDPCLIAPSTVISVGESEDDQNTGSLHRSSPTAQELTIFRNTYTPKVIGIYMEPSVEYIAALLAVLRCGEAFMPLDPAWPKARILSVISSSKARLILGCKSLAKENFFHNLDELEWLIDDRSCHILPISIDDELKEQYRSSSLPWPCKNACLRSFCYLMYTSGSSGKPKGVCGTEIGLLNRFLWMQDLYHADEQDLFLFKTPISFIDHLQEFLGAILTTCTLVIPPFNQLKENILYVIDFLQGYFINRLVAVPSLIRLILPDFQNPRYVMVQDFLKLLILSGEVFHLSLYELLLKSLPHTAILNLYGSTEVTGDCTYFDCKRLPQISKNQVLESIPIGLPIPNCDVILVGEDASNPGEIYVGGPCVAAGYFRYSCIMPLEHIELAPHHNVDCPGGGSKFSPYFKTGDFAKKLPSGDLVFLGRKDRTIKVGGQRIALEEIETTFRDHPDIVEAAVICLEFESESLLEAHLMLKQMTEGNDLLKSTMRNWIQRKLPQMMIPSIILFTKSLPLTSSGKVDYSVLSRSKHSSVWSKKKFEEIPPPDLIGVIQNVFSDVLMVENTSADDNFFEMGGDSISAAYASFKLGIHMNMLYAFPTPLRLQMALASSNQAVRNIAYSGMDSSKPSGGKLRSPKPKPKTHSYHETRESGNHKNINYPPKRFKVTKEQRPIDHDFWNLYQSAHSACSFSRCNKATHRENVEGNNLCNTNWSKVLPRDRKGFLQELWRCDIDSCVDASPLVIYMGNTTRLCIGSHSHKFVCLDAKSGDVFWETKLLGRVECSAAILDDFSQVVVGCYFGKIYFLDFFTGFILWDFQTSGEVKSQPVVDKCRHLVWCGSYDHNLYAIDYKCYECIYKLQCGGSIFSSPAIDEVEDKIFVASTNGHVTAVSLKDRPFNKLWKLDLGAPIFSSLSLITPGGNVISCQVDGSVVVISTSGLIMWKSRTNGPIFAGPCMSKALPSQVLVCSRDGSIYSFEMDTGNLLWNHDLGHPISSSPCVDEDLQLITDDSPLSDRLICVCDSSGSIHVLRINLNALGGLNKNAENIIQEFSRLDLPGEIFSSPVIIGGRIFVGCRDDHVYCIKLDMEK